jgi:hypothetical protein
VKDILQPLSPLHLFFVVLLFPIKSHTVAYFEISEKKAIQFNYIDSKHKPTLAFTSYSLQCATQLLFNTIAETDGGKSIIDILDYIQATFSIRTPTSPIQRRVNQSAKK